MIFSHCLIIQSIFPSIIFIFSFQVVSDSSMIFHLVAYCETPFLLIIYKHKKVFQMGLNHGFGSGSGWIRFFADPDPDLKKTQIRIRLYFQCCGAKLFIFGSSLAPIFSLFWLWLQLCLQPLKNGKFLFNKIKTVLQK